MPARKPPNFAERLGALCKRLGVELRLDPNGHADMLTLAKISAVLLAQQPELQANWNGRGRPKGSVERRPEDVMAIQVIERVAKKRGTEFSAVLGRVVEVLENEGWLPIPEQGDHPTTTPKRLRRLKRVIDTERRDAADALAKALLRSDKN